jgi:hypothetical protein
VRDDDDVVQASADTLDIVGEAAAEPAPQSNAGNNNGAATTPIVPLAAGGPSTQTSRLRN